MLLCDKIEIGFSGTFTAIEDLKEIICDKFEETWTILDDLNETVTECCAELEKDFRETWTILQEINDKFDCKILIRQSDIPLTITQPGCYCLAESISYGATTTAIRIQADCVHLDLNNKCITGPYSGSGFDLSAIGVVADNAANIQIKNGCFKNNPISICVDNGSSGITIDNISTFTGTIGIKVGDVGGSGNNRNTTISNCTIHHCSSVGITIISLLVLDNINNIVTNCSVRDCIEDTSVSGIIVTGNNTAISNCAFQNLRGSNIGGISINGNNNSITECILQDMESTEDDTFGIRISEGTNNKISSCVMQNFESNDDCQGISLLNSNNNQIVECSIQGLVANDNCDGIVISSGNANQISKCTIQSCQGTDIARGIFIQNGNNNSIANSDIQGLTSMNEDLRGIQITGDVNSLIKCEIQDCTSNVEIKGIDLIGNDNILAECIVKKCICEGLNDVEGISIIGNNNTILKSIVQECTTSNMDGDTVGIDITGFNNVCAECIVQEIEGEAGVRGILSLTGNTILRDCTIQGCKSNMSTGRGAEFQLANSACLRECKMDNNDEGCLITTSTVIVIDTCVAGDNNTNGFSIVNSENVGIYNSKSIGNGSNGFNFESDTSTCKIRSNSAVGNLGFGFRDATSPLLNRYINNDANNNGTNYSPSIPNVVSPTTSTGFFANVIP